MTITSTPIYLESALPPTPPQTDTVMLADGWANYTVLNSRLAVNISGTTFEFTRGSIVALAMSAAKQLVADGMITAA